MATTTEGALLTEQHRRAQTLIVAEIIRQLAELWRAFRADDVDANWPAIRHALKILVSARRQTSAGLSSVYYREFRAAEGVPGGAGIVFPRPLPDELTEAILNINGPVSFKQSVTRGKTPGQARDRALVTTSGAVSKLVQSGGRSTIEGTMQADELALGWVRVTDGDPCAFCRMLQSRGAVYKTRASAGDPRGGGMPYHDSCGCTAQPVFSRDDPLPAGVKEAQKLWYEATGDYRGHDKLLAFRRAYEAQQREHQPQ